MNIGYFINPEATPLKSGIFDAIKAEGATEVYLRIVNANYTTWEKTLKDIQNAGLKP